MKFDVKVSKKRFMIDLEECIEILQVVGFDDKYTYYLCEHISLALYKKVIMIAVYEN